MMILNDPNAQFIKSAIYSGRHAMATYDMWLSELTMRDWMNMVMDLNYHWQKCATGQRNVVYMNFLSGLLRTTVETTNRSEAPNLL